ncbi:acyl-CoA dehydrogenase family protein [Microbacterium sp.]|uniref:acyl-CoA dehydrogenase family protein n=1 Tax=Microbacterium sp. TaxID=51671 RepID=UPI0037CCB664
MTDTRPDWDAFTPTEDARELASSARAHFAAIVSADQLHDVVAGETVPWLWSAIVEHGYTAVGLPPEADGLGTIVDLVAVLEESGRALVPAPLTTSAAAMQTLVAVGLPPTPSEATAIAQDVGGSLFAFDGTAASVFVTVDERPDGSLVRAVAVAPAALRREQAPIDPSRAGAFADVWEVAGERMLAATPDQVLAAARTCVAADLVGTAARALDAAVAHARTREQFGRPIGAFQAIKHRLADVYVAVERARSLSAGAAVAVAADPFSPVARELSMLAKAAASDAACFASASHTQVLGAMGLTWEADSPLTVRRARHTAPFLGTSSSLYAAVAAARVAQGVSR